MPIFPRMVRLDISSVCQLKCPSCPTAEGKLHEKSCYMRFTEFKRFLRLNPFIKYLEISNRGEILLNPDFDLILEYAYCRNITLAANNGVNLNGLSPTTAENLARYRMFRLSISIDGATQETYSRYRMGGNFDNVIANIKAINKYKAKHCSPYPLLNWQFVVFDHNYHELPKARALAKELGMSFSTKLPWNEDYSPVRDPEKLKALTGLEAASRSEFQESKHEIYSGLRSCELLWRTPQVSPNGTLIGCLNNIWCSIGNARSVPLFLELQNREMRHMRQVVMGKAPPRPGTPCARCWKYQKMVELKQWVKHPKSFVLAENLKYFFFGILLRTAYMILLKLRNTARSFSPFRPSP